MRNQNIVDRLAQRGHETGKVQHQYGNSRPYFGLDGSVDHNFKQSFILDQRDSPNFLATDFEEKNAKDASVKGNQLITERL